MDVTNPISDVSAREKLTENLRHMVDEADHLLADVERTGTDKLKSARETLEAQLRRAGEDLRRLEERALENARRATRATDHAVHEHPYAAMGIAAAAGLLIGMLISRR